MSNQHKRMCKDCKFWESLSDVSDRYQGTCHYWPPAQSQQIRSIITEEGENPEIAELTLRLVAAKLLQAELISESKRTFDNYPVRKTYGEVQAARSKVEEGISNIDHLISSIEEVKLSKPFAIKKIYHTRERGVWPITASDDWCGQWREC